MGSSSRVSPVLWASIHPPVSGQTDVGAGGGVDKREVFGYRLEGSGSFASFDLLDLPGGCWQDFGWLRGGGGEGGGGWGVSRAECSRVLGGGERGGVLKVGTAR